MPRLSTVFGMLDLTDVTTYYYEMIAQNQSSQSAPGAPVSTDGDGDEAAEGDQK